MQMAMTDSTLRKPATAAARGSVLAVHAAAGLADSVDRDAARLLRASEGMARAAVALLETSAKRTARSPNAVDTGADAVQPESNGKGGKPGVDAVQPGSTTGQPERLAT